ncbi:MAG: MiaB/RimO family radical SAM methylthiotransferase [Planctomycetota bacterium]|jgi:threonylcarbamoyladenosine tRNA methylthiotransferase MtaB
MPPLTYRIGTLGCRMNHAEMRDLESLLRDRGLAPCPAGPADLEVVHTCSVTTAAAAKSRQAIRRARRRQAGPGSSRGVSQNGAPGRGTPPPHVIVTGCFAGTDPVDSARLAGPAGVVLPHASADGSTIAERFARQLDAWLAGRSLSTPVRSRRHRSSDDRLLPLPVVTPRPGAGSHVRAEIRIQDGCDAWCTFCILPRIRPALRSKRPADVVEETRRLVDLGHREVVLSGIFIGAYGHETALLRRQRHRDAEPLADLLDAVAGVPGLRRLRVSSLEPGDVTGPLLDAMVANAPVVVPHLHLPLQAGSDDVLRRMNRQYRVGEYLDMVDRVEDALRRPDGLPPAITTDVICGFPGESDDDFERTVRVARRVGFLHMHVFPYSPRRGTAAARWPSVAADVRKARVRRLIDLETDPGAGLAVRFRRRLVGRRHRVVLEQPVPGRPGWMTGRCDHYDLVTTPTDRARGDLVEVHVTEVTPDRTLAEVIPAPVPLPVLLPAATDGRPAVIC